jgi:hypothetical protein
LEKPDQVADGVVSMLGVTKGELVVHFVTVAAPVAGLRQIAGRFQVVEEVSHGSLGDADDPRDVPKAGTRVFGDDLEDMGVVRDESKRVILNA